MKTIKRCSKFLAVILTVLTIVSILPMQTFATEYQNYKELTDFVTISEEPLVIKEEVISERQENSKTFLLEDGTYCDLIFSNPIHKNYNGEWTDLTNTETYIAEGVSVSAAASQLSSTTTDDGLIMLDQKVSLSLATIAENIDATPDYAITEGVAKLNDTSYGIVTFNTESNKNYEKAEATINVNLIMDYYSDEDLEANSISISPLYLDLSKENITFSDIVDEYGTNPTLDFNGVTGEGRAIWNITSEYIKIENGTSSSNRMLIGQESSTEFTISNAYMQRHYRIIDDNDTGFTYHSVDMGRAGIVYINDYTNTIFVEREELEISGNILPVSISTFINGHMDYATYGVGGRINYESKLDYFANTFVWNMFNGSSVRFQRTNNVETNGNGLEKWVECSYNPQGYTMWVDVEATREFIYSNNYIVDESGNKYIFNSDGYVKSVISGNNADDILQINYTNRRITSITDGVGREFVFKYDFFENIRGLREISINTPDGSLTNMHILYDYRKIDNKLYLTKATYVDGNFVEYAYDSLGRLVSVKNIDGSILELNYAISEELAMQNMNPVYCGRIKGYVKKVVDSTNNYTVEYVTDINAEYPYRRTFKQDYKCAELEISELPGETNSFEETIQFNRNLDVLYFTDDSGNNIYADYDENHKLLSLVTPMNAENLVSNGEMTRASEKACVPAIWKRENISNKPTANESAMKKHSYIDKDTGEEVTIDDYYVDIFNKIGVKKALYQSCSNLNGKKGDKFIISSWGKGESTVPKEDRFWGIKISAAKQDGKYEPIHIMAFDASLWGIEQTRATAFALPFDTNSLKIELISQDQQGTVGFDDICLYKADNAYVAAIDDVQNESSCGCEGCEYPFCTCSCETEEDCTCVSCTIKTTSTNDAHGNPLQTNTTNGLNNLTSQNEYTSDGNYLSKYIDENNVSTSYEYSLTNGLLQSKKLANDNTISYGYDAVGMLKSVSQDVTNVLTGNTVTMNTEYGYENDRIKSVTHNGFSYNYNYDIYGNIISITVGETELVSYAYNHDHYGNISEIEYANGDKIIYSYDNKDNITGIKFSGDTDWRYTYTYDEYNQLKSFTDNVSNRITTYNKTVNGVKYVEVVETLGDNSTIIYGVTEDQNGEYVQSVFGKEYSIKTETQYDSITGNTVITKNSDTVVCGEDGTIKNVCTKDAFERIISDDMSIQTDSWKIHELQNVKLCLKNEYTYKNPSNTQTSRLVDTYTSTIYYVSKENSNIVILNQLELKYDYDSAGRITMISVPDSDNETTGYSPVNMYEYDEAGQLTVEANLYLGMICSYTYDAGGNLTSKNYHENADYDETAKKIILGEPTDTITYVYDSVWKDKLVSYNGLTIDYDALGNPLKYNASIFGDSDTNMNLEWKGRLLTAATKDDNTMRFEYSYDAEGLRTEKIIYTGETISEESVDENGNTITTEKHIFIPLLKFEYIWSGNVPAGYRILIYEAVKDENGNEVLDDNGNAVMQISDSKSVVMNVIYNENGEALGVNCHANIDNTETSTTFLFIKDAQGNISSISALEGGYFFNFYYDAFGNMALDVTGTEIDKIQECINNAETNIEKVIYAIGGGLGAAIVTAITLACVPNAYRGYILDYETGLYYCQSRYYSPTWGRFINADDTAILEMAKGEVHGANLFTYCNNDPINNIDPDGHLAQALVGGFLGGLIAFGIYYLEYYLGMRGWSYAAMIGIVAYNVIINAGIWFMGLGGKLQKFVKLYGIAQRVLKGGKVANNLLKSFSYLAKGVKFIGNMIIKKATRYNGESWATAIMRFVRKDLGLVV